MRILVYGMVGTNRGGIETYLLKMNQNMSSKTIFDYVIEEKECLHSDAIADRKGEVYYVSSRKSSPFRNIVDNYRLLKKQRKNSGVAYFNLSSLSWIFPIVISKILGYRVFVHSHNADFIAANNSSLYRMVNYVNKRILHYMKIKRLTCSKPASNFMFMPSDSVEMIYNAINVERFVYKNDVRLKIRRKLGFDESTFVIGFVGRLQYQKNPFYLIKIMESLVDYQDIRMIVIGDGDMRESLEKTANPTNTLFLGNRTDINELYQAMDVFVLPSFHEGLPYVIIEAQTSGLRCLVSEYVTREVDFSGNVSFLSLESDAENWKEHLLSVWQEKVDRKYLGELARKSLFNIENEAPRLEMLLNSI